ncbi:DUF5076 domain-containing protein [Mucilaginibacter sp. McL0603]|uniref:DUF5076 domain-containing protein n=1 Tax=Mucilaginibacter sp. McL0603 TaxID=3415670 RepID=UPI003CE6915E
MTELQIPPAAIEDQNSFEILRVWAAFEAQHVSIHSGLNGNANNFGYLLAELALHGSRLYAQKLNIPEIEALKNILDGFNAEIIKESGNPTGNIQD